MPGNRLDRSSRQPPSARRPVCQITAKDSHHSRQCHARQCHRRRGGAERPRCLWAHIGRLATGGMDVQYMEECITGLGQPRGGHRPEATGR